MVTPAVTVLGPQRQPTLDRVLARLDLAGPIAAVTAGWQEREADDTELMSMLGDQGHNLHLHARWLDALNADREYAAAEREHRAVLDQMQQLYLLRLDHALRAAYGVLQRAGQHPRTQQVAAADALDIVRTIDTTHVQRIRELDEAFEAAWHPAGREVFAGHLAEVESLMSQAACLVVAGGHVGELLWLLRMFGVATRLPSHVVAWSGGAMVLTDRVVLFNDRVAHGPSQSEVLAAGLGVLHDVVLFPHARRRLRTDDPVRMSVLARRFAPARCVVLDDGMTVDFGDSGSLPDNARVVTEDGRIVTRDAA